MDDAAIIVASRFVTADGPLPLRVVTDWEKRCMELAVQLRQSSRQLREAEEALEACREGERQKHAQDIVQCEQRHANEVAQRLEMHRRQHLQELAFHLERQRQQYALDTTALLDVMGNRLRRDCEEETALRLKETTEALKGEHALALEAALREQKERDDLDHAAQLVELMAQLKEADIRRRNEKRELADKLKGELVVLCEERDRLEGAVREAQTELNGLREKVVDLEGFRERYESEAGARREACDEVITLQRQLNETRKQQRGDASKASLKLKAKLAKLQKDHHELLLIHKQTLEYAREEKLRCGKLEILKEDSEREAKNLEKQNADLHKAHDNSLQALTMARQELLIAQERVKDMRQATAMTTTHQKEVEALREMLKVSSDELKRVGGENDTLRLALDETMQGAFYKAVQQKTFETLDSAKAEVDKLQARLQASPPHRSDTEFTALRALLQTANAEKDAIHAELKAVREAYDKTDHAIQMADKQKEVQKLHGILCMLMAEVKDRKLAERLLETVCTEDLLHPDLMARFASSVTKRAKKTAVGSGVRGGRSSRK